MTAVGRKASQVGMRAIDWVWVNRLGRGIFSGFDGDPERGKSQHLAMMAAHITTGRPWPDGSKCPDGGVILVGAEDSWEATVKPRLVAAGADCSRVRLISDVVDGADGLPRLLSIPEDVELLERTIIADGALLLAFDPLSAFLSDTVNANSEHDVRRALTPLVEMLERTGCAGLSARHLNKQDRVGNALYRGLGSIGFSAVARTVLGVAKDPDDPDTYIFTVLKNNLGLKPRSQRYRIEGVTLADGDNVIPTSRIVWGEETDQSADELMIAFGRTRPRKSAKDYLVELLADGPVDSKEVFDGATEAGISLPTLKRAKTELGVIAKKHGFNPARWTWELPVEGDHLRRGSNLNGDGPGSYSESEEAHIKKLIPFDDGSPRRGSDRVHDTLRDPGDTCPHCGTVDYEPLDEGGRRCNRCSGIWSSPSTEE